MSSYKDNFGKNEESERLGYDDSAFYFFACTILSIVIAVYSYYLFKSLIFSNGVSDKNQKSSDRDTCQGVLKDFEDKSQAKPSSLRVILKYGFLAVLVFLLYASYHEAGSVEQMKAFDPFEILDIPHDADTRAIKKAFRRKSVETHPDKNPNDPLAASKFLQVTRAHQALTDEDAKENYKKYGNPDGPGPIKVAIGLPFFLMKKENQIVSL